MSPLEDMVGPPARKPRPPVARGRVVDAPATAGDPMTVVLVNYSPAWKFDVPASNWMPAAGDNLPAAGDVCVVLFDDDGDAWVPAYGPET
jgi:hypothetical protein